MIATSDTKKPKTVVSFNGTVEKEVKPSMAKLYKEI
jgi:hypothetical protein